ncbi:MAG: response regulator [Nitrospirae bacterium]|nr:response regulator [Nitrospirota bacterium]MBF0591335.1 response regulator [Nitrospirota bacterium]
MPIISLFSGCHYSNEFIEAGSIERALINKLGLTALLERDVIEETSRRFNVPTKKLMRALYHTPSVFNDFTHEKQRHLAYIQLILAERLRGDNLLVKGFVAHLVADTISHVLKVCVIADIQYRKTILMQAEKLWEKEALAAIQGYDNEINQLTQYLFNKNPWEPSLYDILIPLDKVSLEEALTIISENLQKDVLQTTPQSQQAVEDFILASQVNLALVEEGHDVKVSASKGDVLITIDKHTLRLKKLEGDLIRIAQPLPGVKNVSTTTGPGFNDAIYRRYNFELPSKVLLVDDEKDFALTLSKRLHMRDIGTAAVFSGEDALSFVDDEMPDVLVLDLKMDGMDGMEVLRRVKQKHPHVEVIILTGHGTDKDRDMAKELGVYAYFEKPVDIDNLLTALKEANTKAISAKLLHR